MNQPKEPIQICKFPHQPKHLLITCVLFLLAGLMSVSGLHGQTAPPDLRVFDNCPLQGDAKSVGVQRLNVLKNRFVGPGRSQVNQNITLAAVLAPGDDRQRWSPKSGAVITAFVVDVKPGGGETVNCHATDAAHTDTHIELALDPTRTDANQLMIVEVTPRMRAIMAAKHKDWSTANLRRTLKGKWVTFQGWMMFDTQHWNASENTAPGRDGNWRATAWEIHPVTGMQPAAPPSQ